MKIVRGGGGIDCRVRHRCTMAQDGRGRESKGKGRVGGKGKEVEEREGEVKERERVRSGTHFLSSLSRSGSVRSTSLASPTNEGVFIRSVTASSLWKSHMT